MDFWFGIDAFGAIDEFMREEKRAWPNLFATDRIDGNPRKQGGHANARSGIHTKKYADNRQKELTSKKRGY